MKFPTPAHLHGSGRGSNPAIPSEFPIKNPRRGRRPQRAFLMGFALVVLLYSLAVLLSVAWMGDIGVRCIFGNEVKEPIPAGYEWSGSDRPQPLDRIEAIGGMPVANYSGYIRAWRGLSHLVGQWVQVDWRSHVDNSAHSAKARVRYRPSTSYVWSLVWFAQEMVIFLIGARVFWKRPYDVSARLFFWLCVLTVGAYMGGYHWTEIVTEPALIYPFAAFALFVPVVSLHFYLVFPRPNPVLAARPRLVLGLLYGVPSAYLAVLWGTMVWSWRLSSLGEMARVTPVLWQIRNLSLGYIGVAVLLFGLCVLCIFWSYRWAATTAERNQVRWILLASLISSLLIGVLLRQAWFDPSTFGRDSAAWPMFGVSLLYTLAYALSITRYKLMKAEAFINRGMVYVAISVAAGFLYSGVLILSGVFFRDRFLTNHTTSRQAMVAGVTVVLVLTLSELARGRFQKAIDRRFFREKYKFDQAMRKMRLAVDRLVDRETLGRRVLEAAAEVLRLEWGAVYLNDAPGGPYRVAACQGPEPETRILSTDHPLVERLRRTPGLRLPPSVSLGGAADDPAADAMIALGGEAAVALEADGDLAGMLVLGPKRSGIPYEEEELAFLAALSSVATLALHSAGIQQTLETLNSELRDKVGKIAEQQRRILILQDQLTDRVGDGEPSYRHALAEPSVFDRIKGSGRAVRQMIDLGRKVAASHSAVLIRGESGTGKELLAEAIHAASPRAAGPFVKVHCAALSQTLLESELFGHVKGAFTGADRDRVGRFEQADGGTLFLDEIGDINLEVQTKLLRVLQEMSFERVGSSQTIAVDVRILAATHQDLEALIRNGRFREDLYYRLNVISLRAPSLRERREDIFELAVYYLGVHAQRIGKPVAHLDDEAVEALVAYDWPGNIRELENAIERAVVLADGSALTLDDLPTEIRRPSSSRATPALPRRRERTVAASTTSRLSLPGPAVASTPSTTATLPAADDLDVELSAYERQRLTDALDEARGNKSEAARLLGMPRSTFCSKMKKHGML
jgi:transcriptional regulator with GAF, ATPase, and Fis domain